MNEKLRSFYENVCHTKLKDPCDILLKNKILLKELKIEDEVKNIKGTILDISDNMELSYLEEDIIQISIKTKTLEIPIFIKKGEVNFTSTPNDILEITSNCPGVQTNIKIYLS